MFISVVLTQNFNFLFRLVFIYLLCRMNLSLILNRLITHIFLYLNICLKLVKKLRKSKSHSFRISKLIIFNEYFRTAAKENARGSSAHFRYGFHAIPSLSLLHMHVISQDFISDSLKTVCRIHF
jgi:hypothetical protein